MSNFKIVTTRIY